MYSWINRGAVVMNSGCYGRYFKDFDIDWGNRYRKLYEKEIKHDDIKFFIGV